MHRFVMWCGIIPVVYLVIAVEAGRKNKNKAEKPEAHCPSYDVGQPCLHCYNNAIPDQTKFCCADFVLKVTLLSFTSPGTQHHIRALISKVYKYNGLSKKKMKQLEKTEQILVTYQDPWDNCALQRCDGVTIELEKDYIFSGRFKDPKAENLTLLLDLCHSLCIHPKIMTDIQKANLKSDYSKTCADGKKFCEVDHNSTSVTAKTDRTCLTYCFDCFDQYSICEEDNEGVCNWRPIPAGIKAWCAGSGELPAGYFGHD